VCVAVGCHEQQAIHQENHINQCSINQENEQAERHQVEDEQDEGQHEKQTEEVQEKYYVVSRTD
jgi:hypothetical protein